MTALSAFLFLHYASIFLILTLNHNAKGAFQAPNCERSLLHVAGAGKKLLDALEQCLEERILRILRLATGFAFLGSDCRECGGQNRFLTDRRILYFGSNTIV